jgi:hypothetical protein
MVTAIFCPCPIAPALAAINIYTYKRYKFGTEK